MKLNKKWITVGGSVILGTVLLLLVLLKYPFDEVISTFTHMTPKLVLGYLLASLTIMLLFAIRWKLVLKTLGYNLSFIEVFGFRVIEYGISYITPSGKAGGEPVRAALLTRKGIPFKEGLSTVFADKTIELSVSLFFFIFGLLGLAFGYASKLPFFLVVLIISICVLLLFTIWRFYARIMKGKPVFSAVFTLFRFHKIKFLAKYQQAIIDFEKPIIKFYTEERKAFYIALSLSFLSLIMTVVEYTFLLSMLGIEPLLSRVFIVMSTIGFAFLIPVPMGLGSVEAFQAGLFSILGLGSAAGVGLAMITRARDLTWVLVAVGLSLYLGSLRTLIREAFSSKHSNPLMRATVFRNGKAKRIDIKIKKHDSKEDFVSIKTLGKRYELINKYGSKKLKRSDDKKSSASILGSIKRRR